MPEHMAEQCDRGQTNKQETTMVKHGALPAYVYQRQLTDSSTYIRQDQYTS